MTESTNTKEYHNSDTISGIKQNASNGVNCISIGCKVNQAEMAALRGACGAASERRRIAEVCVLNTCAVTATAEAKSRKLIRRLIRQNPDSRLIVTGCLAQAKPEEVKHLIRKGDAVVGNKEKGRIAEMIEDVIKQSGSIPVIQSDRQTSRPADQPRTRAFVKIQDGCNNFCSYCIVPYLRSQMWSKPPKEVDKEIRELVDPVRSKSPEETAVSKASRERTSNGVDKGYKEIVLTGINLGKYDDLTGLLKRLLDPIRDNGRLRRPISNGAWRLRLSSIELEDVSDELINLMAENPRLCPHLHIPLQSGSDRILKLMKRHYDAADFIRRIDLLKSKIDNPSITTDIIVGFPGETEEDFRQTLEVCRKVGFSKIHIFPYSPREGTTAFGIKNKVKPEIVKKRFNMLNNLATELALNYKQLFINKEVEVLVEDNSEGFTDRYIKAKIKPAGTANPNQIVKVKVTGIKPEYVTGIATKTLRH
ncbi:MAG: tRNA (N(6)-L-threonylcarbamoyladenosine(37)-C(2))-methylthiotransferase MtaB [Planctomycetota bacterium]